uniref:Uncharacterized protein n=1 Tax=Manihot esculenta TaxID=3983 RepID=A0A2C9UYV8_MANES
MLSKPSEALFMLCLVQARLSDIAVMEIPLCFQFGVWYLLAAANQKDMTPAWCFGGINVSSRKYLT